MDKFLRRPIATTSKLTGDLLKVAALGIQLGTKEVAYRIQYHDAGQIANLDYGRDYRTPAFDDIGAPAYNLEHRKKMLFYRHKIKEKMKDTGEQWKSFFGRNKPLDTFDRNKVVTRLKPRTMNYFRQEVDFRSRSTEMIIAKRFAEIRAGGIQPALAVGPRQPDRIYAQLAVPNAFGYGGKGRPQQNAVDLSYLQALDNPAGNVGAPEVRVGGLPNNIAPAAGAAGVNGPARARTFLQQEMFQMVAGFSNLINQMDLSTRKMYSWTYMSIYYTEKHISHMVDPDHKDTFAILSDTYRDKANNEGAETEPTEIGGRRPENGLPELLSVFGGWE